MDGSFRVGRVLGIPVGVHHTCIVAFGLLTRAGMLQYLALREQVGLPRRRRGGPTPTASLNEAAS